MNSADWCQLVNATMHETHHDVAYASPLNRRCSGSEKVKSTMEDGGWTTDDDHVGRRKASLLHDLHFALGGDTWNGSKIV